SAISGVVQRLCASPVPRADLGPVLDQGVSQVFPVTGCGRVQRRVTRIDVVVNFFKEEISCSLARGANIKGFPRKGWSPAQEPGHLSRIIADDRQHES